MNSKPLPVFEVFISSHVLASLSRVELAACEAEVKSLIKYARSIGCTVTSHFDSDRWGRVIVIAPPVPVKQSSSSSSYNFSMADIEELLARMSGYTVS